MAGTVTRYGWDASGEMISQDSTPVTATPSSNSTPPPTSILAKHLSFTWQQGKLTDISDTSQTLTISGAVSTATKATHYGYDAVGNRTLERMVVTDAQNHSELLQNNHIRFDAQNRVLDVHDTDRLDEEAGALDIFYVRYDYDENGNRIRTRTRFHDNKNQVHDLDTWNLYDEMNRAVVINGDRNGEDGTFGQSTHVLSYDRAGNRLSDEYLGKAVMARPIVEGDPNAPVRFYDVANGHAIETWHYDAIGRLIETWRGNTQQAEVLETDVRNYDKAGRVLRSGAIGVAEVPSPIPSPEDHEFTNLGATLKELGITAEYRLAVYDKSHRIREKGIGLAGAGADPDPSTDIYFVDALAGSPADPASRFKTGYDGVGNLLGYTIVSATGLTRTMTDWRKGETYQESIVTSKNFDQDNKPNPGQATTSWYDANGNRVRMQDVDIHSIITGVRNFDYDASGHVLKKLDNVYAQPATTTTRSLIVNDNEIGNDDAAAAGEFGSAWESVSSSTFTTAPTTYTVQGDGETLQSVARTLWGDSRLWYRIADANGLHSSAVSKNQILTIPARATTVHDDASTYRPYDVNRHIGSSTPAMPGPTPAAPCGGMGPVITLIIVIIVIALSQGAASGAAGSATTGGGAAAETTVVAAETGASMGSSAAFSQLATRALVANMVSQGVGTIIGTQQDISFKSLALSVVTAGIGYGLGNTFGSGLGGTIAKAAISNATTQIVGMVTHLQETPFSWRAVVGAGISSAVEFGVNKLNVGAQANASAAIRSGNPSMVDSFVASRIGQELIGFSAQYAGAAVSGLYQHGKINSAQIAVDVFGNLVGSAVGRSFTNTVGSKQAPVKSFSDSLDGVPDKLQYWKVANLDGETIVSDGGALEASGFSAKRNEPEVRNPMAQIAGDAPSIPEVQNADGSWTPPNGGNSHPIMAFNGNKILAGRENPVDYSTATIDEENKTINIQVNMNYQIPSFASRISGLTSSITDEQFTKYIDLANAGLAKYWSRRISLNGIDYSVIVSARQSSEGMPMVLANPGSPLLGDLSSRSSNPYPTLTGKLYYDSGYGSNSDAMFSMTAAHEIGHGFLTNAFGKEWSWGHEGTSSMLGSMFPNAPPYPKDGEIGLMPYSRGPVSPRKGFGWRRIDIRASR